MRRLDAQHEGAAAQGGDAQTHQRNLEKSGPLVAICHPSMIRDFPYQQRAVRTWMRRWSVPALNGQAAALPWLGAKHEVREHQRQGDQAGQTGF